MPDDLTRIRDRLEIQRHMKAHRQVNIADILELSDVAEFPDGHIPNEVLHLIGEDGARRMVTGWYIKDVEFLLGLLASKDEQEK